MIARVFHNWERRLAAAAEHRVVRPFEWGLEWIDDLGESNAEAVERLAAWASSVVANSESFFSLPLVHVFVVDKYLTLSLHSVLSSISTYIFIYLSIRQKIDLSIYEFRL